MNKIRKGDEVIVLTGKDKGAIGSVERVLASKVLVAGINLVKKHVKPNPNQNVIGGIISENRPIHLSNVAMYNSAIKKADKVKFKSDNGKLVRYFKSNDQLID